MMCWLFRKKPEFDYEADRIDRRNREARMKINAMAYDCGSDRRIEPGMVPSDFAYTLGAILADYVKHKTEAA